MLRKIREMCKCQKGFTLVELMVVIAIIGILAAIAVPKMAGSTNAAKDAKLTADLSTVDSALVLYYANNNTTYPTDAQGLDKLVTDNLINAVPQDAKGNALSYKDNGDGTYTLKGKNSASNDVKSPNSK